MEYTQYKTEMLAVNLSLAVQAGQPTALFWSEGILFIPSLMPPVTDIVAKEYLEGRIIWSSVFFAVMPTYQQIIKVNTLEMPVIDVTPNSILQQVAIWLKEKSINNNKDTQ